MGFDNECIVNMQSLQGEYFCPVCRLLVYPNEALQTQCTHLYCKPCLAYIVGSTRACPYDGYLVTEADTKPLVEVNKPVADAIGQIPVHCLYYRSGCSWQGSLTECTAHCSGCAFGNSPVVCNRCSTQIVHRQVQEHALNCPGVPPRTAQTDSTLPISVQTTGLEPASQSAKVLTSVQGHTQGNNVVQAQVAVPTSQVVSQVSTYEQWYQQYYQQHPGYDPQQQYAQYYPYQQQQFPQQQTQPQGQYVVSGQQAQSYMQPQPQPQPQVLLPSQSQAKIQQQGLSQPQPTNPQLPIAVQPQMQAQVNSQQPQTQPPLTPQPLAQMQPQVQLPTQAPVGFSNTSNLQTRPQIFQLRNQPYVLAQPRSNMLPQPSSQQASIQQPCPQQPPQPQNSSSHAVTGHQSYPQPQPNQQVLPAIQQQHAHHQGVPQHPPNLMPTHFPSHQPPIRSYNPPPQNHMPVPHLQQPTFTSQGQHLTNSHQSFPVQPLANHIPPHHLPQHQSQHYQLQGTGGQYVGQQVAPFVPQETMQSQQSGHFPASYYAHSQPHLQKNNIGSQSAVSHQSTKPIPVNQGSSQQFTSDSLSGASKFSEGKIKSEQAVNQPSIPVSVSEHEFVIENEQLASQNSVRSPFQQSASQFPPTKDGNQPDKTGQASSMNVASSSQKGMSNVDHPNVVLSSSQSEGNISKVNNGEDGQESKPLTDAEKKPAVRDGEDDVTLGKTIDGKLMNKSNGISVFSDKEGKMFMPTANGKPSSVTETNSHRHTTSRATGAADHGHAQHDQDLMHFAHQGLPGYRTDEIQGIRPEQMQGNSYTQSGYTLTRSQNMAGGPPRPLHDGVLHADHGRWSGEGQFPYPRERQLYGPNVEVPSGVLPVHGASTTFSSGPSHMAPPHMPYHGHASSLGDPLSGASLGGLVHGTFDPSGSLRGRIPPLHGRDSHTGLLIPDKKDYISGAQDSSQEKRCKRPTDDRLMPIPNEGFQGRPDDQFRPSSISNDGSIMGKSDFQEDLKQFPRPIHLGDEIFFASRSVNRPFSSYAGPHMYKADIEGRPRFRDDGMGRSDTPDFLRRTSDFGPLRDTPDFLRRTSDFGPLRSPRRDYPYQAGRFGSGPFPSFGGQLHLDNYDDRDFYGLGDRSKHCNLQPDAGNSFTRTRIPFSAPSWRELEGPNAPGQLRAEEPFTHFRGGERLGSRWFGSNFLSRAHLGPSKNRGPVDIGGPPRLFSVHPRFGEPLGSHMHLQEAGFRNYLSQDFPKNGAHIQDDFEPFIQSSKKKPGSIGWCRICKVDCGTVDNLELHAQTKEHQKEAMDIVLSIKMESAKRQKISSKDQVAEDNSRESQKANNESMGKGLSAVDDS